MVVEPTIDNNTHKNHGFRQTGSSFANAYHRDMAEIEQLSKNESFSQQNLDISRDFLYKLEEKEKEINMLNQYVDQIKNEYTFHQQ